MNGEQFDCACGRFAFYAVETKTGRTFYSQLANQPVSCCPKCGRRLAHLFADETARYRPTYRQN